MFGFIKNIKKDFQEGNLKYVTRYVGGFPEWDSEFDLILKTYGKDKKITLGYHSKDIIESNINDIEIILENERQFKDRVTLTRLFVLGIFAFAFKKKEVDDNYYLTLKFKEIDLKDEKRKYENVQIVLTTAKHSADIKSIYNDLMKLQAEY